jgi:hypothetical protein
MRFAAVVWEDAGFLSKETWNDNQTYSYDPIVVTTVGIVLHEDSNGVVMTNTISNDDLTGPVFQIPKKMIISMETYDGKI